MCVTDGHVEDAAGALRYIMDAAPDEPLFVIRGRDALAVPVLQEYVNQCHKHGLTDLWRDESGRWIDGQARRANEHMDRFQKWQRDNAKLTHLPDPITEDAQTDDGPRHRESRA